MFFNNIVALRMPVADKEIVDERPNQVQGPQPKPLPRAHTITTGSTRMLAWPKLLTVTCTTTHYSYSKYVPIVLITTPRTPLALATLMPVCNLCDVHSILRLHEPAVLIIILGDP